MLFYLSSKKLFPIFLNLRQARGRESQLPLLPTPSPSFPPPFLASLEVLFAFPETAFASFSEFLSASFEALSLSSGTNSPFSIASRLVLASFYRPPPEISKLSKVFGFYFFKIRFVNFSRASIRPPHAGAWPTFTDAWSTLCSACNLPLPLHMPPTSSGTSKQPTLACEFHKPKWLSASGVAIFMTCSFFCVLFHVCFVVVLLFI